MTTHTYDGSFDAPPAREFVPVGSPCVECGEDRLAWVHDEKNPSGHFYNAAEPLLTLSGAVKQAKERARVRPTAAPPLPARPAKKSPAPVVSAEPKPARASEPENAPEGMERYRDPERDVRRSRDTRLCGICGGQRSRHRGRTDHKFVPSAEIRPRAASEILAEIERTLEPMAKWTRVDDFVARPNYDEGSREPHSVRISIDVTLFYREER